MLSAKLSNLFSIAPDWTSQFLLPYMRWDSSKEARDLWTAYAWSARAGPNLLAAIKSDFITSLGKYEELGEQRSNLVHLFLAASLDANAGITPQEIQTVVGNLPESGLIDIANFFGNILGDNEGDPAGTWESICAPWLRCYWPKAQNRNTTKTSVALVQCLVKSGAAFPTALQWAEEFLRPGADRVLWEVQESTVHQLWPADTLKMLNIMIPENSVEIWSQHTLGKILKEMQESDNSISEDQRFQ